MKNYLETLAKVLLAATLILGVGAVARAQQGPPASQQPMEIPTQAQFPPPPGGPQQAPGTQAAPQNDPGAARMSFIHGDVSTQHSDSSDWVAATLNTPVVAGDHISTGKDARAEIQLDHANVLRLSGETTANVTSLARNQMQVQVGQGLVSFDVLKNNDSGTEIDTPNVAIRPQMGEGSYRILVNSDNETIVDVRRGTAEISTPQGSTTVQHDQRITIQGTADNAQYQVSGAPGRDDWDRWTADRDHAIEGAQSWQHTNPNYTGSQDLDAYGRWSNVPDYGDVWFPSADSGWAPYRDGRWVYEPYYGWTWVSYEPWGWAPYHYGRWFVYGGNWGWWPGPVYVGYRPLWAPAYVSFFGFGGGGWGVGVGFGFGGGFGSVGWLPCGPGDRFFPWYGRGINRVNVVNVYNVHNHFDGGMNPLREGPHAYSNVDRAFSDNRVRSGFSSMRSGDFGRGRVPMQQSRIDAGSFRQASMMTGANPVSPSRESFRPSDRQAGPSSIPNRSVGNQRFFNGSGRSNASFQGGNGAGNFNRGGNFNGGPANGARPGTGPGTGNEGQRGFNGPSSRGPQSIQSSRPGWRTFNPPSGSVQNSGGARGFEGRGGPQNRSNDSRPGVPAQPNNSRGNFGGNQSGRGTLSMQQPVVTPRGGNSNDGRGPNGGGYGGRGSYNRPAPSAPNGGYRGAPPSGGSYGRSAPSAPSGGHGGGGSHGGSSGGDHGHH